MKRKTKKTKRKTKKDFNRRQEKEWKEVSSGIESQRSDLRAESERMMIKAIQVKCFQSERQELRLKGVNLPNRRNDMKTDGEMKISPMAEHNPFIHTDGLIRVGSRLINAPLDEEAKIPAILPKGDENVKELVRHYHIREKHGGPVHVCQMYAFDGCKYSHKCHREIRSKETRSEEVLVR